MNVGNLAVHLGSWADYRDCELLFMALQERGIDPLYFEPEDIGEDAWQAICDEIEQIRELEDEQEQYELRERWFRP